MKYIIFLCVLMGFSIPSLAQKVGVVLSGGGAKGLAHIGVLKALEENDIPVDYIVGTSMGGIVAGSYATGMSPKQFEDIILSQNFAQWIDGRADLGYSYNHNKNKYDPSFLKLNLSLNSPVTFLLTRGLVDDFSLNLSLVENTSKSMSVSKGNFDSLFIPLRLVTADIFTQKEVVLRSGVLSDAMRATQNVPFFYNPVRVKDKYLFDGSLYNNFPVDVMKEHFNPDVIIGSNVSDRVYTEYPYKDDEKLLSESLLYMLVNKSNPSQISDKDIYIQPPLKAYTSFDFQKAQSIIDSGYVQTIRQMDEIKSKIATRRTRYAVDHTRSLFNVKKQPLLFDQIQLKGFLPNQQRYIHNFFKKKLRPFCFDPIKTGYYKLVSNDYFKTVYPSINYDSTSRNFQFILTRRPQSNLQMNLGGVIATRNFSSFFLGLSHFYLGRIFIRSRLNLYAGSFYKSVDARIRFHASSLGNLYIEPHAVFNDWNFLKNKGLLTDRLSPTILHRFDYRIGLNLGIPIGKKYEILLYGNTLFNNDEYINEERLSSTDTLDNLQLSGVRSGLQISINTLNRKQYPSSGKFFFLSLDVFSLTELFIPGTTSVEHENQINDRIWARARLILEQYFNIGKTYTIGYYLDAVSSNQPLLANYQGSIINATAFNPLQDSKTLFLRNFRSFNYFAVGVRNIISLRKNLEFRLESYVFHPIDNIVKGENQKGSFRLESTTNFFYATSVSLVYHSILGPVCLSANYYEDAYKDTDNQLGILLHIGFLLFNKAALE